MLKLSKYTLFQKHHNEYLLFNSLSKAFLGITFTNNEQKNKINVLINGGSLPENNITPELSTLIEQGILTNLSPQDEDKLFEHSFYSNYFSNDVATITLAPSLSCNLKCTYCYQSGYRTNTKNILPGANWNECVSEFIKKFIENKKIKKVVFVWFGGEPLLSYPLLKKFSDAMKCYFPDKSVKLKFDIITNNTILNNEIMSIFVELPIESAQITIDGTEKCHDSMRPYLNGHGTYKDIFLNITKLLNETKINIAVRFNLSLENNNLKYYSDFISEMTKNFDTFIKNNRLRLGYPVLASDAFVYKNPISLKEYSENFINYLRILSNAGVDRSQTFKYMPPFCTTRNCNSLVVGPGGRYL